MPDTHLTLPTNRGRRRLIVNIASLLCVFLMMAAAAMVSSGRPLGKRATLSDGEQESQRGDTLIVNTTEVGSSIIGYSGPTPVEIRLVDGRIASVAALDNAETPGFFKRVVDGGLLNSWDGLTPKEALEKRVDGITGATFSSKAIIGNVRAGLETIADSYTSAVAPTADAPDAREIAVIAVIIAAMSVPLFIKNKKYRLAQQLLNVGILGFWGGTFVDFTMMLNAISNPLGIIGSLTILLLLIVAFIYPLFGKEGYYCAWVCPLGALQELALQCNPKHRLRLSAKTVERLTGLRMVIWGLLMLCLWTGLWVSWIDYELFTAFIVKSAATCVIIAGAFVVGLSLFIPRPYCRFICPTGTILRMAQNLNTK